MEDLEDPARHSSRFRNLSLTSGLRFPHSNVPSPKSREGHEVTGAWDCPRLAKDVAVPQRDGNVVAGEVACMQRSIAKAKRRDL